MASEEINIFKQINQFVIDDEFSLKQIVKEYLTHQSYYLIFEDFL